MKPTHVLALAGVVTLLPASRLMLVSSAMAVPIALSVSKVEKVPGPDFQPSAYFANQRAAYQRDKAAHPEKYAVANNKEPEWFFTGKPYDADSKSYFFKYRNYRPDAASWMTPDPAGFPDGPNNYAYAPVPTFQFDKLGLAHWQIVDWDPTSDQVPSGTGLGWDTITHGSDGAGGLQLDLYWDVNGGTAGWIVQNVEVWQLFYTNGNISTSEQYKNYTEAWEVDSAGNIEGWGEDTFWASAGHLSWLSQHNYSEIEWYGSVDFYSVAQAQNSNGSDDPSQWATPGDPWAGSLHSKPGVPNWFNGGEDHYLDIVYE